MGGPRGVQIGRSHRQTHSVRKEGKRSPDRFARVHNLRQLIRAVRRPLPLSALDNRREGGKMEKVLKAFQKVVWANRKVFGIKEGKQIDPVTPLGRGTDRLLPITNTNILSNAIIDAYGSPLLYCVHGIAHPQIFSRRGGRRQLLPRGRTAACLPARALAAARPAGARDRRPTLHPHGAAS